MNEQNENKNNLDTESKLVDTKGKVGHRERL